MLYYLCRAFVIHFRFRHIWSHIHYIVIPRHTFRPSRFSSNSLGFPNSLTLPPVVPLSLTSQTSSQEKPSALWIWLQQEKAQARRSRAIHLEADLVSLFVAIVRCRGLLFFSKVSQIQRSTRQLQSVFRIKPCKQTWNCVPIQKVTFHSMPEVPHAHFAPSSLLYKTWVDHDPIQCSQRWAKFKEIGMATEQLVSSYSCFQRWACHWVVCVFHSKPCKLNNMKLGKLQ